MDNNERYENYENMRKKSTSGRTNSNKSRRKVSMKYSDYIKRLKIVAGATAVATAITISGIGMVGDNISDQLALFKVTGEFQEDVIMPETHRTADRENYFYDYVDIAEKIKDYDDFDEAVYLLHSNIGSHQTDLVLRHTDYESFDNYKAAKGYSDTKDFNKDMRKRVLLSEEVKEKENELRLMQEENNAEKANAETTYGGNNL